MKERWKDIPGFDGYQVSDHGRLRSCRYSSRYGIVLKDWRLIQPKLDGKKRYLRVFLGNGSGKKYSFALSRLLYQVFIGPIPDGMVIDHIDRNSLNNALSNLRLATVSQNVANSRARNSLGNLKGIGQTINGKWVVQTTYRGRGVYLGRFDTIEEAEKVFAEYVKNKFGEFACTAPTKVGGIN